MLKRETIIAAVADYIIGKKPVKQILFEYEICHVTLNDRVRKAGFKLRNRRKQVVVG